MLQNWRSSAVSAHAHTEACVSGHRLDSEGKSMQKVSKKKGNFLSQEETWELEYFCEIGMNLRPRQNLELSESIFCKIGVGIRIFLSEEKREEELD